MTTWAELNEQFEKDRATCPRCNKSYRHLAILTCNIDSCGKRFCEFCGTMAVGGLYVCSKECEKKCTRIYLNADRATRDS